MTPPYTLKYALNTRETNFAEFPMTSGNSSRQFYTTSQGDITRLNNYYKYWANNDDIPFDESIDFQPIQLTV